MFLFIFFFKQKTAYEMRISDWSSDVCSSDLARGAGSRSLGRRLVPARVVRQRRAAGFDGERRVHHRLDLAELVRAVRRRRPAACQAGDGRARPAPGARSEEHTSQLQSLMRISYAVFCLKKNIKLAAVCYLTYRSLKSPLHCL